MMNAKYDKNDLIAQDKSFSASRSLLSSYCCLGFLGLFTVTMGLAIATILIDFGNRSTVSIAIASFFATVGVCYLISLINWIIKLFRRSHVKSK